MTSISSVHSIPAIQSPSSSPRNGEEAILERLDSFIARLEGTSLTGKEIRRIEDGSSELVMQMPESNRVIEKSKELCKSIAKGKQLWSKRKKFEKMMQRCAAEDSPSALVEVVSSSTHASNLVRQAGSVLRKRHGKSEIEIIFDENATWPAVFVEENEKTTIILQKSISFSRKLFGFLFELTNVISGVLFKQIDNKVFSGEISDPETYAVANERIEYEGCKLITSVLQRCVKEEGWKPSIDTFTPSMKTWGNFEGYLAYQKQGKHTERYYEQFELLKQDMATSQQVV